MRSRHTHGLPRGLDKPIIGKRVQFGLWDSKGRLTALQLTVVVSMALQLEDRRVHVEEEMGHTKFFGVVIDDEADALADVVNGPSFAKLLNEQVLSTDAELVVSQFAVVVGTENTTRK